MELSLILDLAKMIFPAIAKCYNDHRGADEYMNTLMDRWTDLESRMSGISSRLSAQRLPGKITKKDVKRWVENVESMETKIRKIQREAEEGKCFSRACLGKHALKMTAEVNDLYDRGVFPDCLVDDSLRNGEELLVQTLIGERTAIKVKEDIWKLVMGDDVRKIGISGMGGIGKSTVMKHINNSLLNETEKFDNIVWVAVSKELTDKQLQQDIAWKLNDLDLKEFDDVFTRAIKLKAALADKKRCVLILDDMWKSFDLKDVGIPEPTSANGCKLVLTTRNRNVCQEMGCQEIKMELLEEAEARELFSKNMGSTDGTDVFNNPHLKDIPKEVLERCGRLPLAIVTTAAIFKFLKDDFEWRDALEDMRTSMEESNDTEDRIFENLKFSYERLEKEEYKKCLLYCALHPKDFKIDKQELIEHLIDEGIIKRNSRQAKFDRGYTILKRLENACLFEGLNHDFSSNIVKMHDLIREMVLRVASRQFKVGRMGLEGFLDDKKWGEDLVEASLMYENISTIPSNASPRRPKLSTLLLQGNQSLKHVPDSLFKHLLGLNVLDLSYTDIEYLPNSVSNLKNLTTLRLRRCENLKEVPSLAKLTELRKLDLGQTGITNVPLGLELLVKLRYLDLNARKLKIMPPGILPKLTYLEYLTVFLLSESMIVKGEEIASLEKLHTFRAQICDVHKFSTYITSLEKRELSAYQIHVGISEFATDEIPGKKVVLVGCKEKSFVLPKDVDDLRIERCNNLTSLCNNLRILCNVPSLNVARELKCLSLRGCKGIEHILCCCSSSSSSCTLPLRGCEGKEHILGCSSSSSSSCTLPLQTLEFLQLWSLDNLCVLFKKEKDVSAQAPPHTLSHLKKIEIWKCSKLEKLLPLGLLLHLHNLEEIRVSDCEQLKEIVEEEKEEEGMDTDKITLPNLRELVLQHLPELKTICSSSKVIVCDSLEKIWIWGCPKLKRFPLSSPPPVLKEIEADECWESLVWDCQDTKNVLQPLFRKVATRGIKFEAPS